MRTDFRSRAALRLLAFALLFPILRAPAQENPAPQPEPIRVSVDRVNVGVIVTDSRGKFVEGLRREEFHVFDDGVEQPITDFAAMREPAQVLLLVEAGPAVYFLEASHLQAAQALLNGLSTGDRVAVVKYDQTPQPLLDFTPDKQAAAGALANVRYYLGFGTLNLAEPLDGSRLAHKSAGEEDHRVAFDRHRYFASEPAGSGSRAAKDQRRAHTGDLFKRRAA